MRFNPSTPVMVLFSLSLTFIFVMVFHLHDRDIIEQENDHALLVQDTTGSRQSFHRNGNYP